MTIREATLADVDRLVAMAGRFLDETPYGALLGRSEASIANLVRSVLTLGVGLVADDPDWPVCPECGSPPGSNSLIEWRPLEDMPETPIPHGPMLCLECRWSGDVKPVPHLVGMLGLVAITHPASGADYADEIVWWVDPEFRGGSIGPRLLAAGETWARRRGLPLVNMVAPEGSDVGRFLARQGYTPIETAWVKRL